MGAIAEGFVAYAQPLIDQTDGSEEQLNQAFTISQLCFNLALFPEANREKTLGEMRLTLNMDDEEFSEFQRDIIDPMIRRHHDMFPRMHRRVDVDPSKNRSSPHALPSTAPAEVHVVTDRYAPCPCNSGKKYKFCCGLKSR